MKHSFKQLSAALGLAAALCGSTSHALTVTATDLSGRSATADINLTGSILSIAVSNSAATAAADNTFVLTGVYFNVLGGGSLTPNSASVVGGSTVTNGGSTSIGNQWVYGSNINYQGATAGISSSGIGGIFGAGMPTFGGTLDNGFGSPNYGLIPTAGFTGGNAANTQFIKNSATFTFTASGVTGITITGFQYGTGQNEPTIPPPNDTPPPGVPDAGSTLLLTGLAIISLGFASRRMSR